MKGQRSPGGDHRTALPVVASLALAGLCVPLAAQEMGPAQPTGAESIEVCGIAPPIDAELARLPAAASLQDVEGAILFVASQIDCQTPAVIAALQQTLSDNRAMPEPKRTAIANAIEALRRRQRGTGSIEDGGSDLGTATFSAPQVVVGGGSATYTPVR